MLSVTERKCFCSAVLVNRVSTASPPTVLKIADFSCYHCGGLTVIVLVVVVDEVLLVFVEF